MKIMTPLMYPRMTLPRFATWLLLATVVVALDLWTKHLASTNLELYQPVPVTSWLNLTLAHNTGAAFSFLAGADGWQRWFFIAMASGISIFLVVWLWRLPLNARALPVALMLLLGGAIGNLVDRIRFGYVIDFIDVHYKSWHWPAFNIADSAIVVGVILMLIESLFPPRESSAKSADVTESA
ncbi:MAG: signal peptidase II [Wenzhouxiangellaceae bacterium]|nr:signal peptidase II [Wenzhouxiangellaceae bacterium]